MHWNKLQGETDGRITIHGSKNVWIFQSCFLTTCTFSSSLTGEKGVTSFTGKGSGPQNPASIAHFWGSA